MGKVSSPQPVKYFLGLLTSRPEAAAEIEHRISIEFGDVDLRSDSFPFDSTDYYEKEMGKPITRRFFSLSELRPAHLLAEIKLKTNEMEALFAQADSPVHRPVNLDPGYIEQSKIVL